MHVWMTLIFAASLPTFLQAKPTDAFNWHQASDYEGNRLLCEELHQQWRWINGHWPEINRQSRPAFKDTFDRQLATRRYQKSLQQEWLLWAKYGERLSTQQLQTEINRVFTTTRDPQKLQQLVDWFGGDGRSFAECLIRPELVRQAFARRYEHDPSIHQATINLAKQEWQTVLQQGVYQGQHAMAGHVVYSTSDDVLAEPGIILSADEWQSKLNALNKAPSLECSNHTTSSVSCC